MALRFPRVGSASQAESQCRSPSSHMHFGRQQKQPAIVLDQPQPDRNSFLLSSRRPAWSSCDRSRALASIKPSSSVETSRAIANCSSIGWSSVSSAVGGADFSRSANLFFFCASLLSFRLIKSETTAPDLGFEEFPPRSTRPNRTRGAAYNHFIVVPGGFPS